MSTSSNTNRPTRKRARSAPAPSSASRHAAPSPTRGAGKKRKKEKADALVNYDVNGPVYDSCNEVRRKIRALLRKGETSIAAFLRELGGVNSNSYRQFMQMKDPMQGSGNRIYPAAYHFFERRRLAEGKPKSKLRQESEAAFQHGHRLQPTSGRAWVLAGSVPVIDRIGRVSVVPEI
jgi:hypothetical protein